MEKHVQIFLNKISFLAITIATLTLIILFLFQSEPQTCLDPHNPTHRPHPKSSCHAAHRPTTTLHKRNHRLWSTNSWRKSVDSFSDLFRRLQALGHLSNHSHALVLSAGGGQPVMSLKEEIGLRDVTGVELVDSPPLVSRADPHSLPFFDGVFDLGFSAHLDRALFPARYVGEMERTVEAGGVCVVCVDECGDREVEDVLKLFRRSSFVAASNVTLMGSKTTMIIARRIGAMP